MKYVIRYPLLVVASLLFFAGCGKPAQVDSARNADELAVLAQSSFYEGELAPAADPVVQLTNGTIGDGGFIPGGGSNGNGNDTGTIPAPGPGSQPPADPGPTPPVAPNPDPGTGPIGQNPTTPPTDPSGPIAENPPTTPPVTPPTNPPVDPTPGDGGVVQNPPSNGNPPSDGGTVPTPPGGGGGPDGGTLPPIAENPPTPPTDPTVPTPPTQPPTDPSGPIAQNPPTVPPVTPPVIPPVTPPNGPTPGDGGVVQNPPGGNPPGDGGTVPPIPGGNPPSDGGTTCPDQNCPGTNVALHRACSKMRSEIPFPNFVFFEEADYPLLSLEATVELPATSHKVQMAGIGSQPHPMESQLLNAFLNPSKKSKSTPVTLARKDLSQVDLMKGIFKTRLELAVSVAKAWYPTTWSQIFVKAAVCDDRDRDGMCQDESKAYQLLAMDAGFKLGHVPKDLKLMVWNGRSKTLARDPRQCEAQYSPVVLDLSGNGFKFTSPSQGVWFDLNDSGEPLASGWTAGTDDAFLVRDLNGNGNIDSGAELFGSATRLPNGSRAANGFVAMRALDSNGNGSLDRDDAAWGELRLWLDRSHDGQSSQDELFTLDRAQVTSINLNYLETLEVDPYGNETRQRSVFRRTVQGRSIPRQVIDVWFTTLSVD